MRVLGVDPGLTRCGVGVVDGTPGRRLTLVRVEVLRTALQDAGIDYESAETSFLPSMQVEVDEDTARKVFRLIDALEDSDDVQTVYVNADVSDEILEALDA